MQWFQTLTFTPSCYNFNLCYFLEKAIYPDIFVRFTVYDYQKKEYTVICGYVLIQSWLNHANGFKHGNNKVHNCLLCAVHEFFIFRTPSDILLCALLERETSSFLFPLWYHWGYFGPLPHLYYLWWARNFMLEILSSISTHTFRDLYWHKIKDALAIDVILADT